MNNITDNFSLKLDIKITVFCLWINFKFQENWGLLPMSCGLCGLCDHLYINVCFLKIYFKLVILVFSIYAPKHSFLKWDLFFVWNFMCDFSSIVTIRADFQQGMESVSQFKKNTVTEIYWLIYAAATVIFSVNELI